MTKKGCNADCCRKPIQVSDEIYKKNANVVGYGPPAFDKNHGRCLPGIDPDVHYTYTRVFFGADREYADDEGWQRVSYRKKGGRKARQWREVA